MSWSHPRRIRHFPLCPPRSPQTFLCSHVLQNTVNTGSCPFLCGGSLRVPVSVVLHLVSLALPVACGADPTLSKCFINEHVFCFQLCPSSISLPISTHPPELSFKTQIHCDSLLLRPLQGFLLSTSSPACLHFCLISHSSLAPFPHPHPHSESCGTA